MSQSAAVARNAASAPASAPAVIPAATDGASAVPSPLGEDSAGDHGGSGDPSLSGGILNGDGRTGSDRDLAGGDAAVSQTHMDPTANAAGASVESSDVRTSGDTDGVGGCDRSGGTGSTEDGDAIENLAKQLLQLTNDLLEKRKNEKQQHADGTTGPR